MQQVWLREKKFIPAAVLCHRWEKMVFPNEKEIFPKKKILPPACACKACRPHMLFSGGGSAVFTLRDICRREVINLEKGVVIGTVDDIVFDEKDARVEALLIYGRPRLFGLLGRDGDVRIPWTEVISFGRDVILVSTPVGEEPPRMPRLRFWEQ